MSVRSPSRIHRRVIAAATALALAFAPLHGHAGPTAVSAAAATPQAYPQRLPDLGDASQADFSPMQ